MNDQKISIGFIGAGRVGFTLGRYFYENNLQLSGYFSRSYSHACDAAAFTHSKSYRTIKELAADSQVIFITVPDSSIHDVYLQLKDYELKDKILCHCSGALSAEVFSDLEKKALLAIPSIRHLQSMIKRIPTNKSGRHFLPLKEMKKKCLL